MSRRVFKVQKPIPTYKGFVELSASELEALYIHTPENPQSETPFDRAHRMGRNSIVIELIGKLRISENGK